MPALVCTRCGLRYDSAALPDYLLSAWGPSCPRCAAPLEEEAQDVAADRRPRLGTTFERHRSGVRRALVWAEQAAAAGDCATAIAWLATIEAIDGKLPAGFEAKRRAWARRIADESARAAEQ
ncbi:MAG TPA: hypothetical protein VFY45_18710 [Baekduia sp.]|nr:hypothetical protein [Baekduia sp.]